MCRGSTAKKDIEQLLFPDILCCAILNVFVKLRLSIQLLLQNLKTMTQKQTHNNLTSNLSYTTARPQLGQSGGQSQLYHEGLAKVDEGKVPINGEYVRLS